MGTLHQVSIKAHINHMNSTTLDYTWAIGILPNCTLFLFLNKAYMYSPHLLVFWIPCIHSAPHYEVHTQTRQYAQHPYQLTSKLTYQPPIVFTNNYLSTLLTFMKTPILLTIITLVLMYTPYTPFATMPAIGYLTAHPHSFLAFPTKYDGPLHPLWEPSTTPT